MTKAYIKPIKDPFAFFKKMEGFKPEKWAIMIENSAPWEDEPFGFYLTKADAIADAINYDLTLVKK